MGIQTYGGIQTYSGCIQKYWAIQTNGGVQTWRGTSKHVGVSNIQGTSKHKRGIQNVGGVQTYGGIKTYSRCIQTYGAFKCMGTYGHPLVSQSMLSLCCVCTGHPNIIKIYWGSSKHVRGVQTYRVSKHTGGIPACLPIPRSGFCP